MKISIGITVCDKDFRLCGVLLKEIEDCIKVPHEIIIIDNREENKDEKVDWKADFSFGYNAMQFAARNKIIELARGDYIWFIDADDHVFPMEEFNWDEDIVAYSFYSGGYLTSLEDDIKNENIFSVDTLHKILVSLWNKLFKTSLFADREEFLKTDVKAVMQEDTAWLLLALKNAGSLRTSGRVIYSHTTGFSDSGFIDNSETIRHLLTGFDETSDNIRKICREQPEIYETVMAEDKDYFLKLIETEAAASVENTPQIVRDTINLTAPYLDEETIREWFHHRFWSSDFGAKITDAVSEAIIMNFGDDALYETIPLKETYWDDKQEAFLEREVQQVVKIHPGERERWGHTLSIVCLVYEGNAEYLETFLTKVEKRIEIPHEVVVVDNRNTKNGQLPVHEDTVLVDAGKNLGILDGRRLGAEHATGEYVWFVDIDDEVLSVYDRNYGDEDVIAFSFVNNRQRRYINAIFEITEDNLWSEKTYELLSNVLWNKWIRKDVITASYQQIPSFFDIYQEDCMLYFTMLNHVQSIKYIPDVYIYRHCYNTGISSGIIKDTDNVDRLFTGFEETKLYMSQNFSEHSGLIEFSNACAARFYLSLLKNTAPDIREYLTDRILDLYGTEETVSACEGLADTERLVAESCLMKKGVENLNYRFISNKIH